MNALKFLLLLEKQILKIENLILTLTLLFLLVLATIQVVLRKYFTAIFWADEFNQMLVLYVGFLGAVLAVKENRHLSIELITNFMPKKIQPVVNILINLFVIYVLCIFTITSWEYYQYKIQFETSEILFADVPKAYFSIIFPIGFGLMNVHYIFRLVELIYNFAGGDKGAAEAGLNGESCIDISVKVKVQ